MSDLLARKRLNENLLDQLDDAQRRLAQMERQGVASDGDGRVAVAGLLLEVLSAAPPPPPAGQVLMYAEREAETVYLRAQDDQGAVKTLESWV